MENITPLIKKQLDNADWLDSAVIDEENRTITLHKNNQIIIEKNKSYIIELSDNLLIDNGDETLQHNWNAGKVPKNKYYKIDVLNIIGKMINCIGVAYDIETHTDLDSYWQGYLPKDKIKVLDNV